ncbi:MAG: DUF2157 domain-containing protein [Desulfobulbaceae bacterium]|nr:DUF2157 domain-containing protein [Desulfobulbaceae bacterium]
MAANWQGFLERWRDAGCIDAKAAAAIAAYEASQERASGWHWQVVVALALGASLLAAGILLFVAAHWDSISPACRFALALTMVALTHIGGALTARRFSALAITLHAIGTVCLGAAIFLTGQIFHLQAHWPNGLLLWALGAWAAWALLRDWPQAVFAAVLTPAWFVGEWREIVRMNFDHDLSWMYAIPTITTLMLALTYLSAITPEKNSATRKALFWIGALTLFPAISAVWLTAAPVRRNVDLFAAYAKYLGGYQTVLHMAAYFVPLLIAWRLRGKRVWVNVLAMIWIFFLTATSSTARGQFSWAMFLVLAVGAVALIQ